MRVPPSLHRPTDRDETVECNSNDNNNCRRLRRHCRIALCDFCQRRPADVLVPTYALLGRAGQKDVCRRRRCPNAEAVFYRYS